MKGLLKFSGIRAAEDAETIEQVGTRLRKACGLQKDE